MTFTRHWLSGGGFRLHVRTAGSGRPVVYFHQSPVSSRSAAPLAARLPAGWRLWAPDTPGFGVSPALPGGAQAPLTMHALAATFIPVLREAGLHQALLVGTHTGAVIALEVARQAPDLAAGLVLDGLPLFTPEECADALANYFPAYTPEWDGSHLARLWARAREQLFFFPWYARDAAHRMVYDVAPAAGLNAWMNEMLYAGAGYARGYGAAFRHDTAQALEAVQVPVKLLYRDTDPLAAHIPRLPARWREPEVFATTAASPLAMWDAIAQQLTELAPAQAVQIGPSLLPVTAPTPGLPVPEGPAGAQLWLRRWPARGPRVLLLHEVGRAGGAYTALAEALERGGFEVLLPDLPGHGESDAFDFDGSASGLLFDRLVGGDARPISVVAFGGHARLGLEMALQRQAQAVQVLLVDPPPVDTATAQRWREAFHDTPLPNAHGGHWLQQWHTLRDRHLFWPGVTLTRDEVLPEPTGLEPAKLQQELFDAVRCRPGVGERWREVLAEGLGGALQAAGIAGLTVQTLRSKACVWRDDETDWLLPLAANAPGNVGVLAVALSQHP